LTHKLAEVRAPVQLKPGKSAREIQGPRRVEIRETLPVSKLGKVLRKDLAAEEAYGLKEIAHHLPWLMNRSAPKSSMALPGDEVAANEARGVVSKLNRGYRVLPFSRNRGMVVISQ